MRCYPDSHSNISRLGVYTVDNTKSVAGPSPKERKQAERAIPRTEPSCWIVRKECQRADAAVRSNLVRVLRNALFLFEYAQDLSDLPRGMIEKSPQDTMRGLRQRYAPQHINI